MRSADGALPEKSGTAQIGAHQTHALPELQGNKGLHGNQGLGPECHFLGRLPKGAIDRRGNGRTLGDALDAQFRIVIAWLKGRQTRMDEDNIFESHEFEAKSDFEMDWQALLDELRDYGTTGGEIE